MGKKLHKGRFERGTVRITDNQVKKHATQMSRKCVQKSVKMIKRSYYLIKKGSSLTLSTFK